MLPLRFLHNDSVTPYVFFHDDRIKNDSVTPYVVFHYYYKKTTGLPLTFQNDRLEEYYYVYSITMYMSSVSMLSSFLPSTTINGGS